MTLPRKLGALGFSSFLSFVFSAYIVIIITCLCLFDRALVPNLGNNFYIGITNFNLSLLGVFQSFPLIIFAFMYQPNLPAIYHEL